MLRSFLLSLARQRRLFDSAVTDRSSRERFVELSSVVVIVCILVALAADGFHAVLDRVPIVEALSLISTDRADAIAFSASTGELPETTVAGLNARTPLGRYVERRAWQDRELVLHLTDRAAQGDEAQSLGFRVAVAPVSGNTVWLCGRRDAPSGFVAPPPLHTTIPDDHLPHFCRARTETP